jgi:ribosomal-protein-alanine N-acetyltransferase
MRVTLPVRLERGPVALRAVHADDVPAYTQAFVDDPQLGELLGMESDPDASSIAERVSRSGPIVESGPVQFAIADASSDEFLGCVILHSLDETHRRCEVGFWVIASARRRGVGRDAVELAVEWAFATLNLLRVEMTTTPANAVVPVLARRLGFAQEGILRRRNIERGSRVDIIYFGVLREEWTARS